MLEISLAAEKIFSIGSFGVTNSMLSTVVISTLLIVFALVVRKKVVSKGKIGGTQNVLELLVEGAFSIMDGITGDHKESKRFFALSMTLFIFVLFANWSGLIPGVGSIGIHEEAHAIEHVTEASPIEEIDGTVSEIHEGTVVNESEDVVTTEEAETVFVPLFRAPSSDLNTTFALALISLLSFQIFGIGAIGVFKYAKKFFNFKNPIEFFVGILEIVSEFAKMISLSFRLFGNVFAGEVLLVVIAFLVPIIAPLPFFALEIFVGLIQAFIFAMLTFVFLKVASMEAH